ncbi:MAG: hypothetical protein V2I27_07765 [Erythrobacter sp.]|jgi:hypothetical protein|nr:hypothetical protein [Erythrobacter sp.]
MNDTAWVSIIALLGWLVLAASAFASYRLSWGKAAQLALLWLAIFGGLFLLVQLAGLAL